MSSTHARQPIQRQPEGSAKATRAVNLNQCARSTLYQVEASTEPTTLSQQSCWSIHRSIDPSIHRSIDRSIRTVRRDQEHLALALLRVDHIRRSSIKSIQFSPCHWVDANNSNRTPVIEPLWVGGPIGCLASCVVCVQSGRIQPQTREIHLLRVDGDAHRSNTPSKNKR